MTADHTLLNTWASVHTALLVDGQTRLSSVIGTDTPSWELSLSKGLLTLNGIRLTCAVIGSVAQADNTWLWSWADETVDQEALGIQRAHPLRQFGQEAGLWEFTQPRFAMEGILDLGMTPGATVAMVASPQLLGTAIFSAPSAGGRIYVVVTDPRLSLETPTAFTTPKIITSATSYGIGNHKDIIAVFAGAHNLPLEDRGDQLVLTFEDSSRLEIVLDSSGKVRQMHGLLPKDPVPYHFS
ncbi:MAG: hypothetical protein FWG08_01970 [Propionibacteriaceae bacterium]|jgi:hypothetical protein|nr:hypothetical protein [Propionibacteriaceae bacterium]